METQDYAKLFGVEMSEEPEAATPEEAPIDEAETEGAEEQETAEPAESEEENPAEGQSAEDNSKYAAARRRAEAEAKERESRMQEDFDRRLAAAKDDFVKSLGIKDEEGNAIETEAAYREHLTKQRNAEIDQSLARSGIDREVIDKLVDAHPAVREARQYAEAARQEYIQKRIREDIEEINKLDPSIGSLEELEAKMAGDEKFAAALKGGSTLLAAYKEAKGDEIISATAAAAARAMENNARSKDHLQPIRSRGTGIPIQVPDDVKLQYRMFNPGVTDEEIAAHYAAHHKQ